MIKTLLQCLYRLKDLHYTRIHKKGTETHFDRIKNSEESIGIKV